MTALTASFVLAVIVKLSALEVRPPLVTVMDAVPAVATKEALIDAVSWVELTRVVVSRVPFQEINAPEAKLLPFTVNVKAPLPAATEDGKRVDTVGVGAVSEKFRLNSGD